MFKDKKKKEKPSAYIASVEETPPMIPMKAGKEILGRLDEKDYWMWRLTIEELEHVNCRVKCSELECRIKELELYNRRGKHGAMQQLIPKAKEEYDRVKAVIEENSGIDLKNCSVLPDTFEVLKLSDSEIKKGESK